MEESKETGYIKWATSGDNGIYFPVTSEDLIYIRAPYSDCRFCKCRYCCICGCPTPYTNIGQCCEGKSPYEERFEKNRYYNNLCKPCEPIEQKIKFEEKLKQEIDNIRFSNFLYFHESMPKNKPVQKSDLTPKQKMDQWKKTHRHK